LAHRDRMGRSITGREQRSSVRWSLFPGMKLAGLSCMCLEAPLKRHTER
ncbi:hypothetical protein T03_13567, partial [Trichinella britovi]